MIKIKLIISYIENTFIRFIDFLRNNGSNAVIKNQTAIIKIRLNI